MSALGFANRWRAHWFLGFSGYHWLVIAAAGRLGIRCFRRLLFNFVAPNCVPCCSAATGHRRPTKQPSSDGYHHRNPARRLGCRRRVVRLARRSDRPPAPLFATIVMYAAGTALCAAATNIWLLIAFRALASLVSAGVGIGAALVARRCRRAARRSRRYLQSSSAGIVLASTVNYLVAGVWFAATPQTSWRYVFLAGLHR